MMRVERLSAAVKLSAAAMLSAAALLIVGMLGGCDKLGVATRPHYEPPPASSYTAAAWEITTDSFPETAEGAAVSDEFFSASKVLPYLGRFFYTEDHAPGSQVVVVLSYDFWQRRYHSPDVIGRQLRLNGQARTIIGVAPRWFAFPERAALWVPRTELAAEP